MDFFWIVHAAVFFNYPGNCCSWLFITIFFQQISATTFITIFRQIFLAADVTLFPHPEQLSWTPRRFPANFAATFFFMSFQRGLVLEFHWTIVTVPWFSRGVWNAVLFQFVFCFESRIALRAMVWFMPCKKSRQSSNLGTLDILFSSNHNINKSSCGLCFWASDPLIDVFH